MSDYFTHHDNMTTGSYSQGRTDEMLKKAMGWIARRSYTPKDIEALGRLAVEWGLIIEKALQKISDQDLFEGNF